MVVYLKISVAYYSRKWPAGSITSTGNIVRTHTYACIQDA